MYCKVCGAWLGDEDVQFCKECGAGLVNDVVKRGWQGKIGETVKVVGEGAVAVAQDIMGEAFEEAKANAGKRVLKKGKKVTNTILKEVGLKPKTPIDIIKKKTKKTIRKLKK